MIKKVFPGFSVIILCLIVLLDFSGCIQKSQLDQARDYVGQSRDYYQRSVGKYKDLIARGESLAQANLELGLLYYEQGEYELALRYFSTITLPGVEKYRGLALYKINDFTGAKDVFRRIGNPDSETLYYYGQVCEKLNLYDQSLDIYRGIIEEPFKTRAQGRIQLITQQGKELYLDDLTPRLQEIIRSAPSAEKYPNAGALILFCEEKVEISLENTAVFSQHVLIKIINERGKQDFSEAVIGYDSTYEKIELEAAHTIRPDGVVVPVGNRHIRDVSKYLNFPLYSNARARIISFPEVSRGCIIEYKYKVYRNQLVNGDDFVLSYGLQVSEPIVWADFKVIIPDTKSLRYKILNLDYNKCQANLTPVIKEYPGYRQYEWEFRDIPAIIPEANIPPNSKINARILISTFDSWQDVYDWWWGLARDKIQVNQAIGQKVKDLTGDKDTILDKARAIYNFCAEDIRYVAVEYGQAGYEPHKTAEVFFNKYGDCKDQAMLLVAMLREIGLESYPVLIGTDDYLNLEEDFPSVNFNHCIAAVKLEQEFIFLDPTCSTCCFGNLPAGDQGRRVLVFTDTGYKIVTTPVHSAWDNYVGRILKMRINPDESIQAQRSVFTRGLYDAGQRSWLRYSTQEAISESLKQAIQKISTASRLIKYDIRNLDDLNKNVVLDYSFSGREYWIKAGNLRILPQLTSWDTSIAAKQARRYPLDLGLPETKEIQVEVILPQYFELEYLPADLKKSSPWLDVSVEYHLDHNRLYFKQVILIKKRYVSLEEYSGFKAFLEEISNGIKKRVVFRHRDD